MTELSAKRNALQRRPWSFRIPVGLEALDSKADRLKHADFKD
jgi:hypothetical protein